jgi:hypothetical protein|tara:strand:- start:1187 stop:1432 length:246 start_codon:yes stop_codon:yes gene_type:complete
VIKVIYYLSLFSTVGWLIGLLAGEMTGDEGLAVVFILVSLSVLIFTIPRDSYISILIRSTVKFIIKKYKAHKDKLRKYLNE